MFSWLGTENLAIKTQQRDGNSSGKRRRDNSYSPWQVVGGVAVGAAALGLAGYFGVLVEVTMYCLMRKFIHWGNSIFQTKDFFSQGICCQTKAGQSPSCRLTLVSWNCQKVAKNLSKMSWNPVKKRTDRYGDRFRAGGGKFGATGGGRFGQLLWQRNSASWSPRSWLGHESGALHLVSK